MTEGQKSLEELKWPTGPNSRRLQMPKGQNAEGQKSKMTEGQKMLEELKWPTGPNSRRL